MEPRSDAPSLRLGVLKFGSFLDSIILNERHNVKDLVYVKAIPLDEELSGAFFVIARFVESNCVCLYRQC